MCCWIFISQHKPYNTKFGDSRQFKFIAVGLVVAKQTEPQSLCNTCSSRAHQHKSIARPLSWRYTRPSYQYNMCFFAMYKDSKTTWVAEGAPERDEVSFWRQGWLSWRTCHPNRAFLLVVWYSHNLRPLQSLPRTSFSPTREAWKTLRFHALDPPAEKDLSRG